MTNKKIPLYIAIVAFAAGVTASITYSTFNKKETESSLASKQETSLVSEDCEHHSYRLKGYQFTRPLLFAEGECESKNLSDIKSEISNKLEQLKSSGVINSASVYLRIFQNGEWTSYNSNEKFNPGSLMKVPVMMTYLKMADKNPELLNKRIKYMPDDSYIPDQTFNSQSIIPGKEYSIKDLLTFMIVYSDNNATHLLNERMDVAIFKQMFVDINIPEPNVSDRFYQISTKDYSEFLKVLFNASYISKDMSDYALSLLSKSDYKDGFLSAVPKDLIVAHKFGEGGTTKLHELHESGIFYISNKPYLLTVMTRGADINNLPHILNDVSGMVYKYMIK